MFKDKLKDLRKQNNLTQDELSTKLGISRQSISKWENGLSYPTQFMLNRICEVFNVTFEDLLNSDEVLLISLDNNSSVKKVKRNILLTSSLVLIVLVGLIIAVWVFNDRINKIETPLDDVEETDVLLGFIVLDQVGMDLYDETDEDSLNNLLKSGLYPLSYTDVSQRDHVSYSNKLFGYKISIIDDSVEENATIYIKKNSGYHLYSVYKILYDVVDKKTYLVQTTGILGSSLGSFTLKFEHPKNSVIQNDVTYNITFKSTDTIEKIELYTYNESNDYISHQEVFTGETVNIDPETLYFVIRETNKTVDDQMYLTKTVVNYSDIHGQYYFQAKMYEDNDFASVETIIIKTLF